MMYRMCVYAEGRVFGQTATLWLTKLPKAGRNLVGGFSVAYSGPGASHWTRSALAASKGRVVALRASDSDVFALGVLDDVLTSEDDAVDEDGHPSKDFANVVLACPAFPGAPFLYKIGPEESFADAVERVLISEAAA